MVNWIARRILQRRWPKGQAWRTTHALRVRIQREPKGPAELVQRPRALPNDLLLEAGQATDPDYGYPMLLGSDHGPEFRAVPDDNLWPPAATYFAEHGQAGPGSQPAVYLPLGRRSGKPGPQIFLLLVRRDFELHEFIAASLR